MTTHKEALTLALEALESWQKTCLDCGRSSEELGRSTKPITAIKEALAQPKQEQNLKLMPREATPEMLKAMDECSTEGYDERLYEGHAGSVYMAAWDAFHGQHCYCGDITNLGVIHRDDGPCHYPDHKEPEQEPVAIVVARQYEDGSNAGNHLEWRGRNEANDFAEGTAFYTHPQPKAEQESVADSSAWWALVMNAAASIEEASWSLCDEDAKQQAVGAAKHFREAAHALYTTPPQRTWVGLTDEEINKVLGGDIHDEPNGLLEFVRAIEAKLKEKNI